MSLAASSRNNVAVRRECARLARHRDTLSRTAAHSTAAAATVTDICVRQTRYITQCNPSVYDQDGPREIEDRPAKEIGTAAECSSTVVLRSPSLPTVKRTPSATQTGSTEGKRRRSRSPQEGARPRRGRTPGPREKERAAVAAVSKAPTDRPTDREARKVARPPRQGEACRRARPVRPVLPLFFSRGGGECAIYRCVHAARNKWATQYLTTIFLLVAVDVHIWRQIYAIHHGMSRCKHTFVANN